MGVIDVLLSHGSIFFFVVIYTIQAKIQKGMKGIHPQILANLPFLGSFQALFSNFVSFTLHHFLPKIATLDFCNTVYIYTILNKVAKIQSLNESRLLSMCIFVMFKENGNGESNLLLSF